VVIVGSAIYLVRSWRRHEWPFGVHLAGGNANLE
jgi:hypothetical protein